MTRPRLALLLALVVCALPAAVLGVPAATDGTHHQQQDALSTDPAASIVSTGVEHEPNTGMDSSGVDSWTTSASESGVDAPTDTTNRLSLEGDVRFTHVRQGGDLGATFQLVDDDLRIDRELHAIDYSFENGDQAAQRAAVTEALETVEDRTATIEERERAVVIRHAEGEASDAEVLRTMVRNYHAAVALQNALDEIAFRAGQVDGVDVSVRSHQAQLEIYVNPTRTALAAVTTGTGVHGIPTQLATVETATNGHVLSIVVGNQYHREAMRYDHRAPDAESQFENPSEAFDRADELYPWGIGEHTGQRVSEFQEIQLYEIAAPHSHGELRAYLDGGTGEIYSEIQVLHLDRLPVVETEGPWEEDGLTVTMNRTPVNGPAQVSVLDGDGEPVDATVRIDAFEYGTTGLGGTLWIVPPPDSFELVVETDTTTIRADVEPSS